jgi:hypothetical protein
VRKQIDQDGEIRWWNEFGILSRSCAPAMLLADGSLVCARHRGFLEEGVPEVKAYVLFPNGQTSQSEGPNARPYLRLQEDYEENS